MFPKLVLTELLLTAVWAHTAAQTLSMEIAAGTAFSLPLSLKIEQPGEQTIRFNARYRTHAWRGAPYYALRLGFDQWSAELLHHKLYLQNPPNEIQHFEVSHGYNQLMVNRAFDLLQCSSIVRIGVGVVIAHPEGRIRGRPIDPAGGLAGKGYYLSGFCFQASFGPLLPAGRHFYIRPEAKLTAAWARIPIGGSGKATVPNVAVHTLLGIGYRWSLPNSGGI